MRVRDRAVGVDGRDFGSRAFLHGDFRQRTDVVKINVILVARADEGVDRAADG